MRHAWRLLGSLLDVAGRVAWLWSPGFGAPHGADGYLRAPCIAAARGSGRVTSRRPGFGGAAISISARSESALTRWSRAWHCHSPLSIPQLEALSEPAQGRRGAHRVDGVHMGYDSRYTATRPTPGRAFLDD